MPITVSEKALKNLLRQALFEAVPSTGPGGTGQSMAMAAGDALSGGGTKAGMFDRPLKAKDETDVNFESTLPDEIPVHASEMMATQLADQQPPIEDPEYTPTSVVELSRAAAAIAKNVSSDQVTYFYNALQALLLKTEEKTTEVQAEAKNVNEDSTASELDDSAALRDIMDITGHRGESGARQYVLRTLEKIAYAQDVENEEWDELIAFGILEFVALLLESDAIDEDDARELKMNPNEVERLPLFRHFIVNAISTPAFLQIKRDATKIIKQELETLNIPSISQDRIARYLLGSGPQDEEKLINDVETDATKTGLGPQESRALADTLQSELSRLQREVELNTDFLEMATSKWEKRSISNKLSMLQKAGDETISQEGV